MSQLNAEQLQAVQHVDGPLLLIAGAGSGKTRVITSRFVYLLSRGIGAQNILALTFTNKAGAEMVERIHQAAPQLKGQRLAVATFHAFGLEVIRSHQRLLGYRSGFSIYDSSDRLACLRATAAELHLELDYPQLLEAGDLISTIKTQRCKWGQDNQRWQAFYQSYHQHLKAYNAVDFDDLITLPQQLFAEHPELLGKYQQQYRYIMVDEFQDTSICQYNFLKTLACLHRNLCCVGDDDQSIYSWRGANYRNIQLFETDFPERQEIKLEQNYRSTATILKAANAVISNNQQRKEKQLRGPEQTDEAAIRCFYPEGEVEEGQNICDSIISLRSQKNLRYQDFGILVRTNTLTRHLEEALLERRIPYQVSGGTSFFQRSEIKDIVSYLRLMLNPDDDINLLRIINTPRRGVGPSSIEQLRQLAQQQRRSLYRCARNLLLDQSDRHASLSRSLSDLVLLIDEFSPQFISERGQPAAKIAPPLQQMVEDLQYWNHLVQSFKSNPKAARRRYDNIMLFISMIERWQNAADGGDKSLRAWLNRISLITRDDIADKQEDRVQLMTIHAAKGLEFPIVYLPGVEEGTLPHFRSTEAGPEQLEEERRLFYVALTRAKLQLYISCCQQRLRRGKRNTCSPSTFLYEIPAELRSEEEQDEGDLNLSQVMGRMPWNR